MRRTFKPQLKPSGRHGPKLSFDPEHFVAKGSDACRPLSTKMTWPDLPTDAMKPKFMKGCKHMAEDTTPKEYPIRQIADDPKPRTYVVNQPFALGGKEYVGGESHTFDGATAEPLYRAGYIPPIQ